jgi:hypothetical protein
MQASLGVEENLLERRARLNSEALSVREIELAQFLIRGIDDPRRVVDQEGEFLR